MEELKKVAGMWGEELGKYWRFYLLRYRSGKQADRSDRKVPF